MEDEDREWFVGVDWAEWARAHDLRSRSGWHTEGSQTHHVFVIDAKGRKVGERGFRPAQVASGVANLGQDGTPEAKYPGLHNLRHFYASWCINRRADGGLELPAKVVQERSASPSSP